jgi:hypothetical protein
VVAEHVYGNKKGITKDLLSWFGYGDSSCDVMMKYMKWRIDVGEVSQGIIGNQLTFLVKFDQKTDIYVISSDHRPLQFNMGELTTTSTIYDKKGNGWDNVDKKNFFQSGDPREDNATQPLMTTSHQFEENIIILETMTHIKKYQWEGVRCYLKNYQRGNDNIRKRHKQIFKDQSSL